MTNRLTPEDLVEIEAIKQVKYRYARCLDQKLWDEMGDLLTEDAVAEYSAGKYRHEGRRRHRGLDQRGHEGRGLPVLAPDAPPRDPPDRPGHRPRHLGPRGHGRGDRLRPHHPGRRLLRGRLRKVDGEWKIEHTGYKRTYEEMFPRASDRGPAPHRHWWATGGASELEA